jgi:septal ring factor EnvC (AmiA/AmiB activator)
MSEKFTASVSSAKNQPFAIPEDLAADRLISGYLREIQELNVNLRKAQDETEDMERQLQRTEEKVRGYEGSAVLAPHQIVDFPQKLRHNVRKMLDMM